MASTTSLRFLWPKATRHFAASPAARAAVAGASVTSRSFGTSTSHHSGHSKWATIKHDKAKNDKAKSRERSIISKDLIAASKQGGPDPKSNTRLALVIANAKRSGMAKSTIEAAIMRGQGINTSGAPLEALTLEAMLPGNVAAVIECLTESKQRLLQELRFLIRDAGGSITPTTYLFDKKGMCKFAVPEGKAADDYLEQAIDAGAEDLEADEEGKLVLYTEPSETKVIGDRFAEVTGLEMESSDIFWDPKEETMVTLEGEALDNVEELVARIEEDSGVQDIYLNISSKS